LIHKSLSLKYEPSLEAIVVVGVLGFAGTMGAAYIHHNLIDAVQVSPSSLSAFLLSLELSDTQVYEP